ncbi:MAG TPA: DUF5916 domain-containing protein, partial [Archangium sp.]|nr:DUF5916 domain-containing protein [Archangium sp.]
LAWLPARSAGAAPRLDTRPVFEAVRTHTPPRIDGRLDEPTWRKAPPFSDFHQSFPEPGAPPSERTVVRVLYDNTHLYVGIRCFDSQPSTINAQLGPRDDIPASDVVRVMIDSLHDRYTATVFSLNAGGTLEDARITHDVELLPTWDGAWDAAASRDARGWSAELSIPLELLPFPRVAEQRWGFHVSREIARTHEKLDSVPLPPETNTLVSSFGELHGLRNLEPPRHLSLVPYVAFRLEQPAESFPAGVRLLAPSVDVGLDAQLGLTSDLTLTLAVNPDFGHVPPDPLIFNIGTTELFLEEKRPFFLEGLELFAPIVGEELSEQSLFYSRRIGLDEALPLLAAVKLSGTAHEDVQVSILDALVAGAAQPDMSAPEPDRRVRFHPLRPLHFAPNYTLPEQVLTPTNFLAGVVQVRTGEGAMLGAVAALNTPLSSRCPPDTLEAEDCTPRGSRAAAANLSLRSPSGDYSLAAQLTGSQVTGGSSEGEVLPDGTLLSRGDTGFGVQLLGGKLGGEPWQMRIGYSHASPRLELNPTGYQPVQNEQQLLLNPTYLRTSWMGLPEARLGLTSILNWTTDERVLPLGVRLLLDASVLFANSTSTGCFTETALDQKDLRELPGSGVAFERASVLTLGCTFGTDPSHRLSLNLDARLEHLLDVPVPSWLTGQLLSLNVEWKPLSRLQTSLGAEYWNTREGPRWLGLEEDAEARLFGERTSRSVTLTLRQLVVLAPRISLQAYIQVLSSSGRYDHFYAARMAPRDILRLSDLRPITLKEDPRFQDVELRSRAVLRWEYATGSTLFLVYTRTQSAPSLEEEERIRYTLLPQELFGGSHADSLLLKLGYMW